MDGCCPVFICKWKHTFSSALIKYFSIYLSIQRGKEWSNALQHQRCFDSHRIKSWLIQAQYTVAWNSCTPLIEDRIKSRRTHKKIADSYSISPGEATHREHNVWWNAFMLAWKWFCIVLKMNILTMVICMCVARVSYVNRGSVHQGPILTLNQTHVVPFVSTEPRGGWTHKGCSDWAQFEMDKCSAARPPPMSPSSRAWLQGRELVSLVRERSSLFFYWTCMQVC